MPVWGEGYASVPNGRSELVYGLLTDLSLIKLSELVYSSVPNETLERCLQLCP